MRTQINRFGKLLGLVALLCALICSVRAQTDFLEQARIDMNSPDASVRRIALGTLNIHYKDEFAEVMIGALDDPDTDIRAGAARNLGGRKVTRAVPNLIALLRSDREGLVKVAAAWALGNIGDSAAVEPMLELLATADRGMRFHIIEALGHFDDPRSVHPLFELRTTELGDAALKALGPSAVEPMCAILASKNFHDRWYALKVLERVADERALETLISVLGERTSTMGQIAAKTIAYAIGSVAIPRLIETLNHPDSYVRVDVVRALGLINDERAMEALLHAVGDSASVVRLEVMESFEKKINEGYPAPDGTHWIRPYNTIQLPIHDQVINIKLDRIANALLATMSDKDGEVRVRAVKVLSMFDREDIVNAIASALSDPALAGEAALGLSKRKDLRALPQLLIMLKGEDFGAAMRAQSALIWSGAVDGLIDVLTDKNEEFPMREIRRREEIRRLQEQARFPRFCGTTMGPRPSLDPRALAAQALGRIGDERARPALMNALKDNAEWLRDAAAAALADLDNWERRYGKRSPH